MHIGPDAIIIVDDGDGEREVQLTREGLECIRSKLTEDQTEVMAPALEAIRKSADLHSGLMRDCMQHMGNIWASFTPSERETLSTMSRKTDDTDNRNRAQRRRDARTRRER